MMRIHISGGRHDDRPWPPAGGEIDVPDLEGHDLIRAGHAVFVRDSVPPPALEPAAPLVSEPSETAAGPTLQEWDDRILAAMKREVPIPEDQEALDAEPEEVLLPAPSAPKQDWIEYAVSQGADPEMAARMTKVDLMSRYGGRL